MNWPPQSLPPDAVDCLTAAASVHQPCQRFLGCSVEPRWRCALDQAFQDLPRLGRGDAFQHLNRADFTESFACEALRRVGEIHGGRQLVDQNRLLRG